ncbi:hypothetical protein J7L18_00170 [Candidatus Bathyarchaeota archaeon]|nr:hypothetical protein [Candidatus Bathyarchaeota archaeon]
MFAYDPRQGRIRIRYAICGRQQSISEKHAWYASEIDLISHEEEKL